MSDKEKSAVGEAIPAAEKVSINNSNIAQSENDCKILLICVIIR